MSQQTSILVGIALAWLADLAACTTELFGLDWHEPLIPLSSQELCLTEISRWSCCHSSQTVRSHFLLCIWGEGRFELDTVEFKAEGLYSGIVAEELGGY